MQRVLGVGREAEGEAQGEAMKVLVHADGGDCHGTPLVHGRCPKCGIRPDTQSTELWPERAEQEIRHRTITCDRESCLGGPDGTRSSVEIRCEVSDAEVVVALRAMRWRVTVHESGECERDRHHCGRCAR